MRIDHTPFVFTLAAMFVTSAAHAAPVTRPFAHALTRPPADPGISTYTVQVDLNEDGTNDVKVTHQTFTMTGVPVARSLNVVTGLNGATILSQGGYAVGLRPGEIVGPAGSYVGESTLLDTFSPAPGDQKFFEPDAALGVRILVGGENYYAWLGAQLVGIGSPTKSDTLLLHDYGYETSANTAVAAQAPEPASLALLGLAAGPLLVRRRR